MYVEYSGTALTAVFKQPVARDSHAVLGSVGRLYADAGITMLRHTSSASDTSSWTACKLPHSSDALRLDLSSLAHRIKPVRADDDVIGQIDVAEAQRLGHLPRKHQILGGG